MAELIWADRALSDLENIFDYIASDSRLYAQYTIQNIFNKAERLQMFPDSGRHLPEFPNLSQSQFILGNYRIIYRCGLEQNVVKVVTVVFTTTGCPAPVLRISTLILGGLPLGFLPLHRSDRFPQFHARARIRLAPPICLTPSTQ
jgi:plasmid stabilization system protein ParE